MKAVNLLPSEHRGAPKAVAKGPSPAPAPGGSSLGAFAVLGALALVLVMVAAYVLAGNAVKEREAELARVQAEVQIVQAQAAALKPYADFRQLAVQRVSTVQQLAASRFDWEQALRDISRALPGDVHLKKFHGSVSNSIGSSGGSQLRSAVASPAIELTGCTTTQSSVAKLMARLRGVRGVTRVSLSKSDKGATNSGATAAPTTPGSGPLCGKTGRPDFELVVFFERSQVAAPGAAAPGTTTTEPAATGQAAPAQDGAAPAATPAPAEPSTNGTTQEASTP